MNDIKLVNKYKQKFNNSVKRNISFELPFSRFKYLMNLKKCQYTGVKFSESEGKLTSRTFERVDSNIGYTIENTVVVTNRINQFKSTFENPNNKQSLLNYVEMFKMVEAINKRSKRSKKDLK